MIKPISKFAKDEDRIRKKIFDRATAGGQISSIVMDTRSKEEQAKRSLNPQELNTSYQFRDADKNRVSNEKELKRIWAEEVEEEGSRSFFDDKLIKVHWVGGYKVQGSGSGNPVDIAINFIKGQPKGRLKGEVSCFGYTPGQGIDHKPTSVGVIINGYTTYVSAIDAATHMTSRLTEEDRKKYLASGPHKRPLMSLPNIATQNMITDEDSWSNASRTFHEIIVDNWSIKGIIIPSFENMINDFKRSLRGIGKERQNVADEIANTERKKFQELGKLSEETGIPFYDDKLQPIDFSGKEFEVGELKSEWDQILNSGEETLSGIVTGDPNIDNITIENKTLYHLDFDKISKQITIKNSDLSFVYFKNVNESTINLDSYSTGMLGVIFDSGIGTININNPNGGRPGISINQDFKLKSATFDGCDFGGEFRLIQSLVAQKKDNSAIINFKNCKNLPDEADFLQGKIQSATPSIQPNVDQKFYYSGPGNKNTVTEESIDQIARYLLNSFSDFHNIYIDGAWTNPKLNSDIMTKYEVLKKDLFSKLPSLPPPPPPQLPPVPAAPPVVQSSEEQVANESEEELAKAEASFDFRRIKIARLLSALESLGINTLEINRFI